MLLVGIGPKECCQTLARNAPGTGGGNHREYREPRMAPPPLLRRMVAAGLLGRKSGRGFYDWGMNPPAPVELGL